MAGATLNHWPLVRQGLQGTPPVVALVPVTAVDTGSSPPGAAVSVVVVEEEVSVGMEVCPASSPRSPGVVCYSRSPGSPPSPTLGSPATGLLPAADLGWVSETPPAPRSTPRKGASPVVVARQSGRISQSRILQDGPIPTIPELAARRAAARDLFPVVLYSGGERPPLEQISALCAKERLEGALTEARCLAARADPPAPRCTPDLVIERLGMVVHPR
ncbi:hypothetical protein ZWY2020_042367 [Hordeum vulgare]|nr:hypothetical protein ZWY2020_042367 [Hordeum vulgare]